MPIRTRVVPYHLVAADVEDVKNKQNAFHYSHLSQRFNTSYRRLDEILPLVAEHEHFEHGNPPWIPFGYAWWQPLIIKSQRMHDGDSFIGRIPSFLWEDLMRCHSAWVATDRMPKLLLDEFIETWTSTKLGKEVAQYFDGHRKWFVRLDQMSPKDSPLGGKLPSTTLHEVITKICSSMRAYGSLHREVEDAKMEGRDMEIKLVFNKWDDAMDPCKEFRIFVPPPLARLTGQTLESIRKEDVKISAISQYRWLSPFVHPYPDTGLEEMAQKVCDGAQEVLGQILDFTDSDIDEKIRGMLMQYGFSFDIIVKEGGEIQLVEINPFGALSGCGACLFNWAVDGKVLYGLEGDNVEFAVTLDGNDPK